MGLDVNRRDLMILLGAFAAVPLAPAVRAQVNREDIVLFCAGVFQPVSAHDLAELLDIKVSPNLDGFDYNASLDLIRSLLSQERLDVSDHNSQSLLYTTHHGHRALGYAMRGARDVVRILLLNPRKKSYKRNRVWDGLASWIDDPSIRTLTESLQSGSWPHQNSSGGSFSRLHAWAEFAETISGHAGLTHAHLPSQLSFGGTGIGSLMDVSLGLGVSRSYLEYLRRDTGKHYTSFERSTGNKTRQFHAPNAALRVVQRYLLNFVLYRIPVSVFAHAYVPRSAGTIRNAVSNAMPHIGRDYIGVMDIENFFPSISHGSIVSALEYEGVEYRFAEEIASLSMVSRSRERKLLPQGGITSGYLSNLVLNRFDRAVGSYCATLNVSFSRYSDDLSFGGDSWQAVNNAMAFARQRLEGEYLYVNASKTRILGPGQQKKITGVVVSDAARPPRDMKRRVRAMLHDVRQGNLDIKDRQLQGYIACFRTFPDGEDMPVVRDYQLLATTA